MNEIEKPRYKTRAAGMVGLSYYDAGIEVDFIGWPNAALLEPLNDTARKIAKFHAEHQFDALRPLSPWSEVLNTFYLPATWSDSRAKRLPPLPSNPTDAMPRYQIGFEPDGVDFAGTIVASGESIAYLGWALDSFIPLNAAAEAVCSYQARGPLRELPSPWCLLLDALIVPAAAPRSRAEDRHADGYRPAFPGEPSLDPVAA